MHHGLGLIIIMLQVKEKLKPERNFQRYSRLHVEKALYLQITCFKQFLFFLEVFNFGVRTVLCCYAGRSGF
jgi:hypothetical protein